MKIWWSAQGVSGCRPPVCPEQPSPPV
jgi:hypothetical protein